MGLRFLFGFLAWVAGWSNLLWSARKKKPESKQYRYDLSGGPYDGDTLVIEHDDITAYTDLSLRFSDHYGFYDIVGRYGYYGTRECKTGEYPFIGDESTGILERQE